MNTYFRLEQFVDRVVDVTNRYSGPNQISYDPANLAGEYSVFPNYGEFLETYALRQYGDWWKSNNATYQKPYRETDVDPLGAEDFILVTFKHAVIPTRICIYETYNPGSIIRIWGKSVSDIWGLMWEGEPQYCPEVSRKFQPDLYPINCLIKTIKLELNCSHLNHPAYFDAIKLTGVAGPGSSFQLKCLSILNHSIVAREENDCNTKRELTETYISSRPSENHFQKLPNEVIIYIFKMLDLKSLSNCASVCKQWLNITNVPVLYKNISFRKYWHQVDSKIFDFLDGKHLAMKKLDLSWCGKDDKKFSKKLFQFLSTCHELTHVSFENVSCFNGFHLAAISSNCPQLEELRLKNTYIHGLGSLHYLTLCKLNRLVTLDLSGTNFDFGLLHPLLVENPNLRYLNLDFCDLGPLDYVLISISKNNKKLKGLSCWKVKMLSLYGTNQLRHCHDLEVLDLGWCNDDFPQGETLYELAEGCPKLKRLILSSWRSLTDTMLRPIILNCRELEQLDVSSVAGITSDLIEEALLRLPNLKLLELSYCTGIAACKVKTWRARYPNIHIKHYMFL